VQDQSLSTSAGAVLRPSRAPAGTVVACRELRKQCIPYESMQHPTPVDAYAFHLPHFPPSTPLHGEHSVVPVSAWRLRGALGHEGRSASNFKVAAACSIHMQHMHVHTNRNYLMTIQLRVCESCNLLSDLAHSPPSPRTTRTAAKRVRNTNSGQHSYDRASEPARPTPPPPAP